MVNTVVESFFDLLKRKRIRPRTDRNHKEVRQNVFDCIDTFYQPKRKHATNGMLSPVEFKRPQRIKTESVQKTRGCSDHDGTCGRGTG